LDGVIADTQRLHARVEELVLRKRGIVISAEEITRKYAGLSDEEFFKLFDERDYREMVEEKWRIMEKVIKEEGIREIEGVCGMVRFLKETGLKLAVASSSPRKFVKHFDVIVTKEDVSHIQRYF
jgi:beta-phosphoglucomutase-like phosphatase (HAD superfamily)